jgi:hypothetical protein
MTSAIRSRETPPQNLTTSFGQPPQFGFSVAPSTAVKVKLGVRQLFSKMCECLNRQIESLMPLKAAWKENDKFSVVPRPRVRVENRRIGMIDEYRTLFLWNRA